MPLLFRSYIRYEHEGETYVAYDVMHDQKVVILMKDILKDINVRPGDQIYIYAVTWYIKNGEKYLDYNEVPASYTYAPIKPIIDAWYRKYISR